MSSSYHPQSLEDHRQAQKFVDVNGGKIAYLDEGEGPVIVLVHGVPTSSWLYRKMIPALVEAGFRVIAPDLLGFGSSDKPKGLLYYDFRLQGQRLLQLMEQLNVSSWTHVLHDAGGLWTWELLLQDSSKISHLVILNTIAYEAGFHPPLTFKKGSFWGKCYAFLYRSALFCKFMINSTLKTGTVDYDLNKAERRGYWKPMSEGTSNALHHFFTSFEDIYARLPEYQAKFESLDTPAICVWGTQDKILVAEAQVPKLSKTLNISDSDHYLPNNAAHFIQEEIPEEIVEKIVEFVRP